MTALAAELRALPPSCGPVRLVAVDGHAGSGKTTFAGRLAAALGGAPVVHLDDLATHRELFGWADRLREQVLEPLAAGRDAEYRVYDWTLRRFAGTAAVPVAPVVLVEGVGAGRRAVRPWLARVVWMELDAASARRRGEERDGPELAEFWAGWARAESAHFAADPSRPYAVTRVDGVTGRILSGTVGEPSVRSLTCDIAGTQVLPASRSQGFRLS
ncbi:uridine kinase family protein [Kitasatospora brasiliensis]|uniref:uridine kinase family protein n=1 Tax=Kitasatospora brasiliensis TaxID=3058040 RepID=UPI002931E852|nr:AAA family ATPase [Kitasatospora sp. K002]